MSFFSLKPKRFVLESCKTYYFHMPQIFAMLKTADKGTILNDCYLLLLAVFLPKRTHTAANG